MSDTTFDRLERKPAYITVAATIRQKIVSGQLEQDGYLPPEQDFADQLGVTRQTLREAVRLLETSGLVTRGKRRRLMVARPSMDAVGGSLREAMILHQVTYHELWELHLALDPGVAALAAKSVDAADKERLAKNMSAMAEAVAADVDTIALDVEFHTLILESTHNRALRLVHDANIDVLYGTVSGLVELEAWQRERVLEAHRHIADAVTGGDAEVARLWMTRHLEDIRRGAERAGVDMNRPFVPTAPAAGTPAS